MFCRNKKTFIGNLSINYKQLLEKEQLLKWLIKNTDYTSDVLSKSFYNSQTYENKYYKETNESKKEEIRKIFEDKNIEELMQTDPSGLSLNKTVVVPTYIFNLCPRFFTIIKVLEN